MDRKSNNNNQYTIYVMYCNQLMFSLFVYCCNSFYISRRRGSKTTTLRAVVAAAAAVAAVDDPLHGHEKAGA
jgi:hypothetical protein